MTPPADHTYAAQCTEHEVKDMGCKEKAKKHNGGCWEKRVSICVIILAITIWIAVTESGLIAELFLPSPVSVVKLGVEMWQSGRLQANVLASSRRVLIGYSIGTVTAIIIGLLMGRYRIVEAIIDPIFQVWRPIPPIAAIPLLILWVGIGEASKIIVIAGGTFAVCLISVITGIKNVPRIYIDSARILGAKELDIFRYIILPSAVPYILSGMRTSIASAFGVMVAAELIASFEGIGFMLIMGKNLLRTDMIFLGLILIGLMVYISDIILKRVESRLTGWMERA